MNEGAAGRDVRGETSQQEKKGEEEVGVAVRAVHLRLLCFFHPPKQHLLSPQAANGVLLRTLRPALQRGCRQAPQTFFLPQRPGLSARVLHRPSCLRGAPRSRSSRLRSRDVDDQVRVHLRHRSALMASARAQDLQLRLARSSLGADVLNEGQRMTGEDASEEVEIGPVARC